MLSRLKRLGIPMVLHEVEECKAEPFGFSAMRHKVQRMRVKLGLPSHFTFDACRRGRMTEPEEAELTRGQRRALSAHRPQQGYIFYAKRTEKRVLAATRKRHARRLVNEMSTDVQISSRMNRRNKVRLASNIKWLGREGSNLRMAESKSA